MAAKGACGSGHWTAAMPTTTKGTGEEAGGCSYGPAARGALGSTAGIQARDLKVKVLGDLDIKTVDSGELLPHSTDEDAEGTVPEDEMRAARLRLLLPVQGSHAWSASFFLISIPYFLFHVFLSFSLICWPEFRAEAYFYILPFILHESFETCS